MKSLFLCALLLLNILTATAVHAAIITRVGTGTFEQNSGIRELLIEVRSDSGNPDITSYATDFTLIPQSPPLAVGINGIGPLGNTTFGQPGFFGEGNIFFAPIGAGSFFDRITSTTASLSLELTGPVPVPSTFQTIAIFQIDTTNLPLGSYTIQVEPIGAVGPNPNNLLDPAFFFPVGSVNGSFQIVAAVPEPGSLAVVSFIGLSALARRRFLKRYRLSQLDLTKTNV